MFWIAIAQLLELMNKAIILPEFAANSFAGIFTFNLLAQVADKNICGHR